VRNLTFQSSSGSGGRPGFDSVVFDMSGLPLEENTRSTRQAVEELSPLNPAVVVEGER